MSAAETPALVIDHVTKRFVVGRKKKPVVAIDDVSMRIKRGEIYGVLGANGSGKSTLIRLVSTLLTIDQGEVEVFGHDITKRRDGRSSGSSIASASTRRSSRSSRPPRTSSYAARLYGVDARWAAARVGPDPGPARGRRSRAWAGPLEQMSRGMQQKVAIARALLTSPTLLLLDEPTTGLDPRSKLEVQSFIEDVMASHDATIVLTTHDMEEADRLCNRLGDPGRRPGRHRGHTGRAAASRSARHGHEANSA